MSNGFDYELSRLAYREWIEQYERIVAPMQEKQPGFLQRMLAALNGLRVARTPDDVSSGRAQQTARAAAK